MKVLPYKRGLASSKLLRDSGAMLLSATSRPRTGSVVHAWGASALPSWGDRVSWINRPDNLSIVSNKRKWAEFSDAHLGDYGLSYTSTPSVARSWADIKGAKVICRTTLTGSNGEGIVIARNSEQIVEAPMYSLYFKKTAEYRVMYSFQRGCVFVWSKRRPEGNDMDRDALLIRTVDSGYVYQRESWDDLPDSVKRAVRITSSELEKQGIELLAYDVVYSSVTDNAKVVEANSAAGLNEETAPLVVEALKELGARL